MTEKNTITLIIVAIIGAFGAILAACIGLIPVILPVVRPTSTPLIFNTDTFTPSFTPLPETPSATFAPPTDTPTETPTLQSLETPTETQTTVPTPAVSSSDLDQYEGTWTNVDKEPGSENVNLVITRIEVSKTGDTTADLSLCRLGQDGDVYVQPNPAPATMYPFGLTARDFTWAQFENLRWAVIIQRAADELVVTVQEFDANNVFIDSETYQLQKTSLLDNLALQPCSTPVTPTP